MTETPQSFPPSPYEDTGPQPPYVAVGPRKTPSWAIVIGVISIVLAGLALICTPISLAVTALIPEGTEVYECYPPWYRTYTMFTAMLGIVMAVVLLLAGISLLRRRNIAAALHLAYGVISAIMVILNIGIMAASIDIPEVPDATKPGLIGGMIGSFIGLVYPVFLIVWFMRRKIREEMANWQ